MQYEISNHDAKTEASKHNENDCDLEKNSHTTFDMR